MTGPGWTRAVAGMPRAAWLVPAFALAAAAVLASALWFLRAETLRIAHERTLGLSQVVAEQSARTLQAVDSRLQLVIHGLETLRAAGPLEPDAGRRLLARTLQDLHFVRGMRLTDLEGRVVLDSGGGAVGQSAAERPYVRYFREHPDADYFVGLPARSSVSGRWVVTLSRPMRDAAGELTGVVTAALDRGYFEELWQRTNRGRQGTVVLYNRDGRLLMRTPMEESAIGADLSKRPLFAVHLAAAPTGLFTDRSPIDGVERIIAYRVLPAYDDLVAVVGAGVSETLAPWRRLAQLAAVVWLVAVLVAAALAWQLQRQSRSREATERRFSRLAQAMPQIVFIADAAGCVRFVNQRWEELTGQPVAQALGVGWQDFMAPDDRAATTEILRNQILGDSGEIEHAKRLRARDGSYRWQLLRAVRHAEGGQQWWYGTATDVHELKEAQARVQEQAALVKLAGRLARLGGWQVDLARQRVRFSEEAAAALDLPPDTEPPMQEVLAMFTPRSRESSQQALGDCMRHAIPFDVEVEMRTPAGRLVWLRSIGQPVRDADGQVVAIQGAQQDITQRVRLLEEIRQLNTGLEEKIAQRTRELLDNESALRLANAQLEAFAYSVSHDLQSPLHRICSFARLLEEEDALPPGKARHYLARIRANADTMTQLIEGLLALARVTEVEMIRSTVNLSDVATEILQRLQADQPQRQVAWQVQPGLAVSGDVRLLRSVLENLLGNAWKFTGGRAQARIEVGAGGGAVYVRDNGAGFDMAYADRLFGTFQRLHDSEAFPGTGIGLATVARAISRHGGKVWAEAAPEQGATFFFTLPDAA